MNMNFKTIFKFIAGSNLYGTSTKDSDIDTRGVFIPPENYFYGFLHRIEQTQDKKRDIEYHEIRKFLILALDNNPNIIEYLFVPKDKWIIATDEWKKIIDNTQYFVSKKSRYTFSGYAYEQLRRIKRHRGWLLNPPKKKPKRVDYGLPEHRSTLSKEQIGAFNALLAIYLEEIRSFHKLKEQILEMEETHNFKTMCKQIKKPDLSAIKAIIPISDNFLEALEKEKAYMNSKREWDQYQEWKKNRNPKRAELERKFGYDCKHGSHLWRLMGEGRELLKTGHLTFPRPDKEDLLSIRNGGLKYEELLVRVGYFDKMFDRWYDESPLPREPNREKIDKLCIELVKKYLLK